MLGVFLDPVYQRMQNSTDHAIQNHVCWQGGIFTSVALESLSLLTGQQMKKRVQAASAPQGFQVCFLTPNFNFDFFLETVGVKNFFLSIYRFGGSWDMLSNWCLRFLNTC